MLGNTGFTQDPCLVNLPVWLVANSPSNLIHSPFSSSKPHWSCNPPVTLLTIAVPASIASVELSPHPSLLAILTTTSATLYIALSSCGLTFASENNTLYSGANVFHIARKSVPLPSTTCVCIKSATLDFLSSGKPSTKCLNAKITSPGCFLLIFLLFQNKTKSTLFLVLI